MRHPIAESRFLRTIYQKRQLIAYLICSLVTTLGEMVLGWLILRALPERILIANTIALIVGGVAHYWLTTKYAFRVRHTVIGVGMYAATFFLGLFIQNFAVAILYHALLDHLPEFQQYLLSKVISMAIALLVTYLLRDWLNNLIHNRRKHR